MPLTARRYDFSSSPGTADTTAARVSIFTALEEQLGLKLSADKAAVDVFAVRAAHLPEPD